MVAAGCDSDETITGKIPIVDIDGLRVELPCIGTGTADVNCATPDVDGGSFSIFNLHVSSPEMIYYLNAGSSYIDEFLHARTRSTDSLCSWTS